MTAADIFVGSFLLPACMTELLALNHEFWGWMRANLSLGEGRERTQALVDRLTAYQPSFAELAS